ncbi:Ribokinase-like protein [Aureobasidium subglaciale]|nr:Ribokinase-like protein [Aureobasidium subglaciale]
MPPPTKPPIITIIGSLNVDIAVYTPRVPGAGETFKASSSAISMGGKGANQAVACAKLSRRQHDSPADAAASVHMIGAVGDDSHGEMIMKGMAGYGVDMSGVKVEAGQRTGSAFIIVEEATAENRIMICAEANDIVLPSLFMALLSPRPDLIILQLEIPLATVLQVLELAKSQEVPVLLNPAPAQKLPFESYSELAHLVMNETEACLLADCAESELETSSGISKVAHGFGDRGVHRVIITLGSRGVYYLDSRTGEEGLIRAGKVKVLDTTAAGDTWIGSYALSVVGGDFRIAQAVEKANLAAAITVQRKGAQQSIPWSDEV